MKKVGVNDAELAYRDEGAGPPIIFLHAFPLNQSMWDDQRPALASNYRVITFDWRGFGESSLGGGTSTMGVFADDLAGLMNELGIDRATICGLSMGGYAAFAFYRKYAARVAALVLANTRSNADTEDGRRRRYEMVEVARQSGLSALADKMIPKLLAPITSKTKPQIVRWVRSMIEGNQAEGIARALIGMAERPDSTALLLEINCPTLVLVGSEDGLAPPSEAEKMGRLIPDARLEAIQGAGHLSNLERVDDFNRALVDFLERS